MKTFPNRVIKTALSSSWCVLQHIKILSRSHQSFIERWALQVAHASHKRAITEIHPAVSIIDRISPFQVPGIYLDNVVQYFPNRWVLPTCSDISRHRIVVDRWERHEAYVMPMKSPSSSPGRQGCFSIAIICKKVRVMPCDAHGIVPSGVHSLRPGSIIHQKL